MSPTFFCLFEFEFSGNSKTRFEQAIIFRAIVLERVLSKTRYHISPYLKSQSMYVYMKSTTVYVPSSELVLSQPLSRQRVCPSTRGGGAHSPEGEGFGESQFRRLEKKLSILPTLWSKVDQSWEIWLRGSYSIKADLGGQLKGTVAWDGFFDHYNLGPKLAEIGIFLIFHALFTVKLILLIRRITFFRECSQKFHFIVLHEAG